MIPDAETRSPEPPYKGSKYVLLRCVDVCISDPASSLLQLFIVKCSVGSLLKPKGCRCGGQVTRLEGGKE